MHFRHHGTGHAARGIVTGPEAIPPDAVGQIFQNRQTVPDDHIAIPQDRHLAARGREIALLALGLFPILAIDVDGQLLEMEPGLLDCQPATQGPA